MIVRIWHGWTTPANADRYEELLQAEIFVGIGARKIDGHRDRAVPALGWSGGGVVTLMRFTPLDALRRFAGEVYEPAVVPESARRPLSRFDLHSAHYEIISTPET